VCDRDDLASGSRGYCVGDVPGERRVVGHRFESCRACSSRSPSPCKPISGGIWFPSLGRAHASDSLASREKTIAQTSARPGTPRRRRYRAVRRGVEGDAIPHSVPPGRGRGKNTLLSSRRGKSKPRGFATDLRLPSGPTLMDCSTCGHLNPATARPRGTGTIWFGQV